MLDVGGAALDRGSRALLMLGVLHDIFRVAASEEVRARMRYGFAYISALLSSGMS
jgi:hypothetical protein